MGDDVNGSPLPLVGVRVASVAVNVPGPAAAARLRELGAEVTKIEPPEGDPLATASPDWYASLAEGQRVVRLDLKTDEGRSVLHDVLATCDGLLTSSRPAALARMGLAWDDLRARYPRLVQVAILGHAGGRAGAAGHDLTYLAPLGLLSPPALPRTLVADLGGAERAATTLVALLLQRETATAAGRRYAEVALADVAAFFSAPWHHGITRPTGLLGGAAPIYGLYEAAGGWIALGALEPRFQERLRAALGLDRLDGDALAAHFRTRTPAEWERWAEELDIPLAAVDSRADGHDGATSR